MDGIFCLPNNFLLNFKSDVPIYLESFYLSRNSRQRGRIEKDWGHNEGDRDLSGVSPWGLMRSDKRHGNNYIKDQPGRCIAPNWIAQLLDHYHNHH
jgi:hypothetical protein